MIPEKVTAQEDTSSRPEIKWPPDFLKNKSGLRCPDCPDITKIGLTACEGCCGR